MKDPIPKLTPFAQNFLNMAKARDETVSGDVGHTSTGQKKDPCGKDTKAFWFLLGYGSGYYAKEFEEKKK